MRIFSGRRLNLESLVFSPDGRHIACLGTPTDSAYLEVRVLEVAGDGLAKQKASMVTGSVSFTPDGAEVIFPSRTEWYRMAVSDGRLEHDSTLTDLKTAELSADGRWAVVCDVDSARGLIRLYVAKADGNRWRKGWERELRYDVYGRPQAGAYDHWETFASMALGAGGTRLLVGLLRMEHERAFECSMIRVLDTTTGEDLWSRRVPFSAEHLTTSAIYGDWLATFDRCLLHVTDFVSPNYQPITRTNTSRKHFTAVAFSPDGKMLATTSNDTTVTMWDTATWEPIRQYGWEIGKLRAVAFAPDGLTCAAGSDTGKVVLFDVDG